MDVRRELFASSLTPVIDWPCNIWPYDVIPISKPVHLFDLICSVFIVGSYVCLCYSNQ